MSSIHQSDRKVPQLSFPPTIDRRISFEERIKKSLPFLSPRGLSRVSQNTPRHRDEKKSDEKLQHTVEKVWLDILELLAKPEQQRSEHRFKIPFSQGLLFGELLTNEPSIRITQAEENGRFTIVFSDPSASIHSKKKKHSRTSSATNLKERITHESHMDSPNYLRKFLEISEVLLQNKKNRLRKCTVEAAGFDRQFLSEALTYHYSTYIETVTCGTKTLHISLRRGVRNLDELSSKVTKLSDLAYRVGFSTSHHFEPQGFCYQNPSELSESHLFNHRRSSTIEGTEQVIGFHNEFNAAPVLSSQVQFGRSEPKEIFQKKQISFSPYSPCSLPSIAEQEISDCELYQTQPQTWNLDRVKVPGIVDPRELSRESKSKFEAEFGINLENEEERDDWVISHLVERIRQDLKEIIPDSIHHPDWKSIWKQVKNRSLRKSHRYQNTLLEIISLKQKLANASFKLIDFLNDNHRQKNLSKTAQMKSVPEKEISRCIYPDGALQPLVTLKVNDQRLIFEKTPWTSNFEPAKFCFRSLLRALLNEQHRFSYWNVEQLVMDIFHKEEDTDFLGIASTSQKEVITPAIIDLLKQEAFHPEILTLLQEGADPDAVTQKMVKLLKSAHSHHPLDSQLISMLKASTFGFGANVYYILMKKFEKDYTIKDSGDEITLDFFTNPSGDCEVIRTSVFKFLKDKIEIGKGITRLISSYSSNTGTWAYRLEIPEFLPNRNCSLSELKWIHERLLAPEESSLAKGHRERGKGKVRHAF